MLGAFGFRKQNVIAESQTESCRKHTPFYFRLNRAAIIYVAMKKDHHTYVSMAIFNKNYLFALFLVDPFAYLAFGYSGSVNGVHCDTPAEESETNNNSYAAGYA